tara:strand:- start:267 stop:371 length:105 start_codon:yes stop_codon:yes gene_type:complete
MATNVNAAILKFDNFAMGFLKKWRGWKMGLGPNG